MKQFTLTAGLISGLVLAAPAFAQPTANATKDHHTSAAHATKQKTQSDPTNSYLFKPGSGDYAARPAHKQRTDGEDVTGNNNFPAASK
jgi:hypothetical protein